MPMTSTISANAATQKWKSCKYLGSLIGTEEDTKRRKGPTHDKYHAFDSILKSKLLSVSLLESESSEHTLRVSSPTTLSYGLTHLKDP